MTTVLIAYSYPAMCAGLRTAQKTISPSAGHRQEGEGGEDAASVPSSGETRCVRSTLVAEHNQSEKGGRICARACCCWYCCCSSFSLGG